jgi:hypothetical protein
VKSRAPRMAAVLLLASAWLSAGVAPFMNAIKGAPEPIDFVRDYVVAHSRLHQGRGAAAPSDEGGNIYAAALGAPIVVLLDGPYHLHPPPALLPVLPLVPLGFAGAAIAWLAISLVALFALALGLVALIEVGEAPPTAHVLMAFGLLLIWPPVLHNLAKGQWSILLAALVLAGFRALESGRPRAAGVWLGIAASLKATPLLLLGLLMLRHRRAAWSMLATMAVALLASLIVGGVAPWRAWLADAPRDVTAWQTWPANTVSINGLIARLTAGGPFTRPLIAAPPIGRALFVTVSLTLVAGVAFVTRRAAATSENNRCIFAAWVALVVLLNPLGWTHTATLALIPLALLAGQTPLVVTAALTILTIPRETLAALAGVPPVGPGPGIILSFHALAVVGLLFVSVRAAMSARRQSALVLPPRL